jgi:hypothetical protein
LSAVALASSGKTGSFRRTKNAAKQDVHALSSFQRTKAPQIHNRPESVGIPATTCRVRRAQRDRMTRSHSFAFVSVVPFRGTF